MNDEPLALAQVADNRISRDRVAALCKLQCHSLRAVDHQTAGLTRCAVVVADREQLTRDDDRELFSEPQIGKDLVS